MNLRVQLVVRHLTMAISLVVSLTWLWSLDDHHLAVPPSSLDAFGAWIDHHDAITIAFALIRLEAIALAVYLLALTLASGFVRWLAFPRATRLVDRLTLPVLRGMFGGVAALGVMVAPSQVSPSAPGPITTTTVVTAPSDDGASATLHLLPPDTASVPVPTSATASPVDAPDDTAWIVQPGDSFWSIAESQLLESSGGPVTDAQVADLWQRLIDLNRDRLANPDDPDLIFTGQVFELPTVETG